MREKTLRCLLTFHTTTDAMAVESYAAAHSLPGRLIPVPSAISAGCGLAWSAPPESRDALVQALETAGLRIAGQYELPV